MSLQRRRERYVIMTLWKILNGHHPNNMGIEFQSSKRNGITAKLPKLSKSGKAKHQTMYDTSFAVLGPKLWNLIPANVSSVKDLEVFKIELKKDFLSKMPDKPPVKGYSCENNNSLLEWVRGEERRGGQAKQDETEMAEVSLRGEPPEKVLLVAVFEEEPRARPSSPESSVSSNGHASPAPFLEPLQYNSHFMPQQPIRAEIEVNEAVLKSNIPLLVRSSSDSALAPPLEVMSPPPHEDLGAPDADVHSVLRGPLDRTTRQDQPTGKMPKVNFSPVTKTVAFSGDQGPLGIHVVPYNSSLSGRSLGLHIKGIEPNSRSRRDGIFQEDECIVQINDTPLLDKTFAESQEAFRQVLGSPRVRLQVLSVANKPRYEKSLIGQLFTGDAPPGPAPTTDSPQLLRPAPAPAAAAKPGPPAPPKTQVRPKTPDPSLEPLYPAPGPRGGAAAGRGPRRTPTPPLPAAGPRGQSPPPAVPPPVPRGGGPAAPPAAGRAPRATPTPPLPAAGPRGQSPPPAVPPPVPRGGGPAAPPAAGRAPRATPTPPLPAAGPRGQTPPPPVKGPVGAGPRKGGKRLNIELQKGPDMLSPPPPLTGDRDQRWGEKRDVETDKASTP
ncbi:unnamed protein product [Boreogadus saida]